MLFKQFKVDDSFLKNVQYVNRIREMNNLDAKHVSGDHS
jgi:hypothetical protein